MEKISYIEKNGLFYRQTDVVESDIDDPTKKVTILREYEIVGDGSQTALDKELKVLQNKREILQQNLDDIKQTIKAQVAKQTEDLTIAIANLDTTLQAYK